MSMLFRLSALAVAASLSVGAYAMGGASGPKTTYQVQGHLGEIVVNPYKIAPLTAVIRNGGYQIEDARVTILAAHARRRPRFRSLSRLRQQGEGRLHARLQRKEGKVLGRL